MADAYLSAMKTVFMIAPYFIPRRRVGSLRPYKFAIHLREFGWEPVICTIQDSGSKMTETEQKNLEGIKIIKITPPFDRTTHTPAQKTSTGRSGATRAFRPLVDWLDRQIPMDAWIFLFKSRYGEILRQAKTADPDIVWSTGDPWSAHWVGHKLSGDLGKPWVADFRDPWTLTDLNLRGRSRFSMALDRRFEKRFVQKADKVIFTARSAEKLYSDHYGLKESKTETIYNSYHLPEPNQRDEEWIEKHQMDSDKLHLLFFGSFRRLSPAEPIAKALAELHPNTRNLIMVHSFGPTDKPGREAIDSLTLGDHFIEHEKVKPEAAPSVFEKADILLVSTNSKRRTIIPAKLWEYMASQKPILSITPNPEIGEILKQTGRGVHFSNNQTTEIATWLATAVENVRADKPIAPDVARESETGRFSSRSTTRQLAGILDQVLAHE